MSQYLLWGGVLLGFILLGASWLLGGNIVGYLVLKITKRVTVGDYIHLRDYQGQVEQVGWQMILLKDKEKQEIYIPNASIFNYPLLRGESCAKKEKENIELTFPLPAGEKASKCRQVVWEAAALSPYLGLNKPIEVSLVQHADQSTRIRLVAEVAEADFAGDFETAIIEAMRQQFDTVCHS